FPRDQKMRPAMHAAAPHAAHSETLCEYGPFNKEAYLFRPGTEPGSSLPGSGPVCSLDREVRNEKSPDNGPMHGHARGDAGLRATGTRHREGDADRGPQGEYPYGGQDHA